MCWTLTNPTSFMTPSVTCANNTLLLGVYQQSCILEYESSRASNYRCFVELYVSNGCLGYKIHDAVERHESENYIKHDLPENLIKSDDLGVVLLRIKSQFITTTRERGLLSNQGARMADGNEVEDITDTYTRASTYIESISPAYVARIIEEYLDQPLLLSTCISPDNRQFYIQEREPVAGCSRTNVETPFEMEVAFVNVRPYKKFVESLLENIGLLSDIGVFSLFPFRLLHIAFQPKNYIKNVIRRSISSAFLSAPIVVQKSSWRGCGFTNESFRSSFRNGYFISDALNKAIITSKEGSPLFWIRNTIYDHIFNLYGHKFRFSLDTQSRFILKRQAVPTNNEFNEEFFISTSSSYTVAKGYKRRSQGNYKCLVNFKHSGLDTRVFQKQFRNLQDSVWKRNQLYFEDYEITLPPVVPIQNIISFNCESSSGASFAVVHYGKCIHPFCAS